MQVYGIYIPLKSEFIIYPSNDCKMHFSAYMWYGITAYPPLLYSMVKSKELTAEELKLT